MAAATTSSRLSVLSRRTSSATGVDPSRGAGSGSVSSPDQSSNEPWPYGLGEALGFVVGTVIGDPFETTCCLDVLVPALVLVEL